MASSGTSQACPAQTTCDASSSIISFDKKPFSGGSPAIDAAASVPSVAVIGIVVVTSFGFATAIPIANATAVVIVSSAVHSVIAVAMVSDNGMVFASYVEILIAIDIATGAVIVAAIAFDIDMFIGNVIIVYVTVIDMVSVVVAYIVVDRVTVVSVAISAAIQPIKCIRTMHKD